MYWPVYVAIVGQSFVSGDHVDVVENHAVEVYWVLLLDHEADVQQFSAVESCVLGLFDDEYFETEWGTV